MWKFKLLLVPTIILGTLLFGVVTAHAWGWWWNAQVDVGGTEVHTAWAVNDDANADNYRARIKVYVPEGVDASVTAALSNETVTLHKDADLACGTIRVVYKISGQRGVDGEDVAVWVTPGDGSLDDPDATGDVGDKLTVTAAIGGACGS